MTRNRTGCATAVSHREDDRALTFNVFPSVNFPVFSGCAHLSFFRNAEFIPLLRTHAECGGMNSAFLSRPNPSASLVHPQAPEDSFMLRQIVVMGFDVWDRRGIDLQGFVRKLFVGGPERGPNR
jgi:hypothetical protein